MIFCFCESKNDINNNENNNKLANLIESEIALTTPNSTNFHERRSTATTTTTNEAT